MGQAIIEYAPESDAHQDYQDLCDWLEEHAVKPMAEIEIVRSVSARWPIGPPAPPSPAAEDMPDIGTGWDAEDVPQPIPARRRPCDGARRPAQESARSRRAAG